MSQLQEAGFDITASALGDQSNRYLGDEKLFVKFLIQPKQNGKKSAKAGRPIFEDTEYVTIMVPGDKSSIVIRPCDQRDKDRFPKQYQAFKNNEGDVLEGTPLEAWPGLSRSQVEELKYFNIRTVEQLATLNDSQSQKFMGISVLKKRAADFLDAAEGNAVTERLNLELEERDNEIIGLKQGMAELIGKIDAIEANQANQVAPVADPEEEEED